MSAKFRLLVILLCLVAAPSFAQFKIGFKVSPSLALNRIADVDTTQSWETNAVAPRIIFGPFVDIVFAQNYYFTTGLWYAPKQHVVSPTGQVPQDIRRGQYLQVPLALKLYTDEIRLDTRLYIQMGGVVEIKVADTDRDLTVDYIPELNPIDGNALLAAGIEYRWGYNTLVFAGVSYQRGLFNNVATASMGSPAFDIKTDLIGLDMGIKF